MKLDITYRGHLESCNYDCAYCPFAKKHDDKIAREKDRAALEKFLLWLKQRKHKNECRVLFTPWGEALIRRYYREAIVELSSYDHVKKIVIQTNLSAKTDWLQKTHKDKVALWATYHPEETTLTAFVDKLHELEQLDIKHSVGIVGKKEYKYHATTLKKALPKNTTLWVNAFKDINNYYSNEDILFFKNIDPLFDINRQNHISLHEACNAGETAVSIDGDGTIKRCHFVNQQLGNIYDDDINTLLKPRTCPNQTCDCYIGYMHLKKLQLNTIYGDRTLERIPVQVDHA